MATTSTGSHPPPETLEDLKHENLLWSEMNSYSESVFPILQLSQVKCLPNNSSSSLLPSLGARLVLASIVWHALFALKIWMSDYEVWPLDDLKQVATSCKMSFPANMSPVLDVLIPHSTYLRVRISTNVHICAVIWKPYIWLGSFPSYLHSTLSF